ncbi:unnamed protein product [Ambrosiozyma monospora]|uniref:Unnamed protein product n=1 Tax=Ambrosiozyma monospora TaxID=43982 RepID=A0A9W6YTU6_AMBMO|nr:unnamed protein product [Ambrosiozyma monospora]
MIKYNTDFSKYCIKQHNSNTFDPNYKYLPQISANIGDNFGRIVPHDLFTSFANGLYETMNSRGQKWQEFALVDTTTDKVTASARFLIKKTDSTDCSNVVVSWVNTNKEYQKQGLMGFLLSQCIRKFEDPDGFQFDNGLSDDSGVAQFVKSELTTSDNFWTLYSAVKDYYTRFGFRSFKGGLKIIISPAIPLPTDLATDPTKFELKPNESFLTSKQAEHKLTDKTYLTKLLSTRKPTQKSTSLTTPSLNVFMITNDLSRLTHYNHPNPDNFGFSIKDTKDAETGRTNETFVIISSFVSGDKTLLARIYTSVDDLEKLNKHLERILQFAQWRNENYLVYLPYVKENLKHTSLMFSANDIFVDSESGKIKADDVVDWFKGKGWTHQPDEDQMLPMMKKFGKDGVDEDWEWVYNGLWCFD